MAIVLLLAVRLLDPMNSEAGRHRLLTVDILALGFILADLLRGLLVAGQLQVSAAAGWTICMSYFILGGCLGWQWFYYAECEQDAPWTHKGSVCVKHILPLAALVLLTLSAPLNGWAFTRDAQGVFQYSSLTMVLLALTYSYPASAAVMAFVRAMRPCEFVNRSKYLTLAMFGFVPGAAALLQRFIVSIPVSCLAITYGLLIVHMNNIVRQISLDALTGLNNRRHLMAYLNSRTRSPHGEKKLWLLMLDGDRFKVINDTYGHPEGDRALTLIALAMCRASGNDPGVFASRYGGDEFAVVCESDTADAACLLAERIRNELAAICQEYALPYSLTVSIGAAQWAGECVPELLARADHALYADKQSSRRSASAEIFSSGDCKNSELRL